MLTSISNKSKQLASLFLILMLTSCGKNYDWDIPQNNPSKLHLPTLQKADQSQLKTGGGGGLDDDDPIIIRIGGWVVDNVELPIENAAVQLIEYSTSQVIASDTTNEGGSFDLGSQATGTYFFKVFQSQTLLFTSDTATFSNTVVDTLQIP